MWDHVFSSSLRSGPHLIGNINSPLWSLGWACIIFSVQFVLLFLLPFDLLRWAGRPEEPEPKKEGHGCSFSPQSGYRIFWQQRKRVAWEEVRSFHIQREELCLHQGPSRCKGSGTAGCSFCLRLPFGLLLSLLPRDTDCGFDSSGKASQSGAWPGKENSSTP